MYISSLYGKDNLLKDHPDGLGKLIQIYENGTIVDEEINELIIVFGCIPFYFKSDGTKYICIIDSEIVDKYIDSVILTIPNVDELNEIYIKCKDYIEKAYTYLNITSKKVCMIGAKFRTESVLACKVCF